MRADSPAALRLPLRAIAILLLLLAVPGACGPAPSKTGRGAGEGPYGGRFVFPLSSEPTTLNFVTGSDLVSDTVGRLVGDGLVDCDERLQIVPRLAESWEFSPDGRVLTFHLRRGARFHDGLPVTSADVRYTYERVIDPRSRAVGRVDGFLPVERVETPDEETVRVTYRFPYSPALAAWEVPILPRHLYEREDFLTARPNRAPVGTGPFRFVGWEAGRRIVLAANEDYWGGRPFLDSIELPIVPSEETRLQALLAGEIDYATLTPMQWVAHASDPSFARRFDTIEYPSLFTYYIAWRSDGSNPFFTDPLVRRAMALALDREGYVRNVLRGAARVSASLFHPSVLPPDPAQPAAPFDPTGAAELLDRAGWPVDPRTGLRTRRGVPFRFALLIFSGGQDHVQFSQVAQESLQHLGIEMSIQRLDWPTLWGRLQKGEFQAALSGFVSSVDPDGVAYGMLHSSQVKGGQNYAGFNDPQTDAWIEEGRREVDPVQRQLTYRRIERRASDLQPYTCLFSPMTRAAMVRRIGGVHPGPRGLIAHYPGLARLRVLDHEGP
ncbi:MAG TPA: ABC transporter substrate-binding protein [Candidatus Polarisedimenticolia bacterium]|jgi:peptide/nickel transport system substrate-binding protein|nr:ABC transporter substrate-binding protein [Candidatus Polarisedimenticolia bacterium]